MLKSTRVHKFQHLGESFALISDIHLPHYGRHRMALADSIGADGDEGTTLVLAGDIIDSVCFDTDWNIESLKRLGGKYKQVVWVLGNHEFIDHSPNETLDMANELAIESGIKVLENDAIDFGSFRLHGATGWYPYQTMNEVYQRKMIDFRRIRHFSPWVYEQHAVTRRYLNENVQQPDIVVTHHLPHARCVHPKWEYSSINRFFVGHFDEILATNKPAYWLCGHSHEPDQRLINETMCLRHPYGYPGEESW